MEPDRLYQKRFAVLSLCERDYLQEWLANEPKLQKRRN